MPSADLAAAAVDRDPVQPPARRVAGRSGVVGPLAWREAGRVDAEPIVLLHGIGSGSGSWQAQLASLAQRYRVLAWDAPGYGQSAPLATSTPMATDYAAALADSLDALGVEGMTLVGHSLGALIGAAFAATRPQRVRALVLASPARGYGASDAATRERVWTQRTGRLAELGIAGMAASRSAALCSPSASAAVVERVRETMARITVGGYRQAVHLLVHDDIEPWLATATRPCAVLCGELDAVTTPEACRALAARFAIPFVGLPGLAHACYVEGPGQFDAALLAALDEGNTGGKVL